MPTYDYRCKSCSHTFERRMKIADREAPASDPCKECGGEVQLAVGVPMIVGSVKGPESAPAGFREVLKHIHKGAGKESKINA
ncbi:transcriptional regulator [Erwinia phage vB_EamM-Bue1]|uniref:Putative regulatory protein FmdB family n=2 Tax=Nezavisimistyvirus TaxID=2841279 RepID=A0A0A0YR36_9CAUD|nr:transcriptional regulator [Erwinia phage phiEa2809]YP_009837656.1 transcriptional regulator [Erwinia phage vB_EamM-Bue1]AIX13057.1 putative regulatory protein FmdB family [Erwinia phage phiEa2809]AVO22897.1 hypothetical protein [Erwinia phage vB_EamM-Bue1]